MTLRHAARRASVGASTTAAFMLAAARAIAAPAGQEDIRDIRGPIAIPPWWHLPLALALAAAAVFAIVRGVRWWRARKARPLTSIELARRALDLAEEHARQGRLHAWADLVAETIRGALAVRLGTEILPQTTSELAKAAWAKAPADASPSPSRIDAPQLLELLGICDLARFANASLDTDALLAATTRARAIVEQLHTPVPTTAKGRARDDQAALPEGPPQMVTS